MTKRDIEDVIEDLVVSSLATVVVPEREHMARRPSATELAPLDDDPRVLVDESLWSDIGRSVECKPQMATGTIPPPIGAYCLLDPVDDLAGCDTDKLPRVALEISGEIELDALLESLPDPEITLDED